MANHDIFSPGTWQFWSNSDTRPKRTYEAMLLFSDLMFGGATNALPPYMVKSFSRPGYRTIGSQKGEYQLRSGDYAKIDYPTQGFETAPLDVTLMDVNVLGSEGADTAGHINAALSMMQKTWTFEEAAMGQIEGAINSAYQRFIDGYVEGSPQIITILELDGRGGVSGEWSIYKPILVRATFSGVSYDRNDLATIDLSFEYKNFKFTQGWSQKELEERLRAATGAQKNDIGDSISRGSRWQARS